MKDRGKANLDLHNHFYLILIRSRLERVRAKWLLGNAGAIREMQSALVDDERLVKPSRGRES